MSVAVVAALAPRAGVVVVVQGIWVDVEKPATPTHCGYFLKFSFHFYHLFVRSHPRGRVLLKRGFGGFAPVTPLYCLKARNPVFMVRTVRVSVMARVGSEGGEECSSSQENRAVP